MDNYVCTQCGASNVKLWRRLCIIADSVELHCLPCAEKASGHTLEQSMSNDQLMNFVPAIPTELPDKDGIIPEGETYWGYSSVPDWGVKWWHELPPEIPHTKRKYESREETEKRKIKEINKFDQRCEDRIKETKQVFLDRNRFDFWEEWHEKKNVVQIYEGMWQQIGSVDEAPVCASVSWLVVDGELIAFVEMTSKTVDIEMLENWVKTTFLLNDQI